MKVDIDLGTSNTVLAYRDKENIKILKSNHDSYLMPSRVLLLEDDSIIVGWDALTHPKRFPNKSINISAIKRQLGKTEKLNFSSFSTYPQEISALVLSELKCQFESLTNQQLEEVVIAIPSHFDENQRSATIDSAKIAGLKVARLLNEATVAAIAYSSDHQIVGKILVFDLGGGTLDLSVIDVHYKLLRSEL